MIVSNRFIFGLMTTFLFLTLLTTNKSEAFQCPRGYHFVNGKCQPVQIPPNAELDFTGHGWVCKHGFRLFKGKCVPVVVPENAELDFTGHGWVCKRGYYMTGEKCKPVVIPPNADLDFTGHSWVCKRGYYLSEGKCKLVVVPQNAEINFTGHNWVCRSGFKNVGNQCIPMTSGEIEKQQQQTKKIYEQIQRRRIYVSDKCDAAYKRCVSECEDVSIYDYDSGNYISINNTDFLDNCESACARGRRYSEDEDADEKCYEFKRACRNDCPSDVYDYDSGEYLMLTDADSQCEDACRAGERACESW
ncbi:hypothetical protein ACFL9U_17210 [Thermodesulfobacteriota bacterium]